MEIANMPRPSKTRQPSINVQAPQALSERKAAVFIGMSPFFLRRRRREGTGPVYLKLGSAIRYRVADLENWLAARDVRPGHVA
jgi:hypothetical protein